MTRETRPRPRCAALGLAVGVLLAVSGCGGGASREVRTADDVPPAFLVASADTALVSGDPDGARRLLDRALEVAPESAYVHVAWGRLQTALRRYKDAKDAFERAAALAPRSPEPAYWLGRAYQQAGDTRSAAEAYERALRLDPGHRAASEALVPILGARYEAAGIPADYALLRERPTLSRGELAVVLAVELGADPDRAVWRSDAAPEGGDEEFGSAWGGRWVRAAASRGWITPFADGTYHLGDPVTRAALALAVVSIERRWGRAVSAAPADPSAAHAFPDLGPRHYLAHVAEEATALGLPPRGEGGRFEPWAAASGADVLATARSLARAVGATPVVSAEPH